MANLNPDEIAYNDETKWRITQQPTFENTLIVTEETALMETVITTTMTTTTLPTENNNTSDGPLWSEREQMATVIIAVAFVAIVTICVVLIILRSLRNRSNRNSCGCPFMKRQKSTETEKINKGEKKGTYSYITNDNQIEPKWEMQQQAVVGADYVSDRLRKVPTRNPENRKWYDSAAIPFMDEVSASLEDLYTDQQQPKPQL
ncbi:unnamed protein product [Trichobilharzia szidati]|nr:unnamed protein product [Trichobilharzia szidati]